MPTPIISPEISVKTAPAGVQLHSTVAAMANGEFVIAWYEGNGADYIFQQFRADGSLFGSPETIFADASNTLENRIEILGTQNNQLSVAFVDTGVGNGDVFYRFYERFSPGGDFGFWITESNVSTEHFSAENAARAQGSPSLALDPTTGEVHVGMSHIRADGTHDVEVPFYSPADYEGASLHNPIPDAVQVEAISTDNGFGAFVCRDNASGNILFQVDSSNPIVVGAGSFPHVARLAGGGYVIAWQGNAGSVVTRLYEADGKTPRTGAIDVFPGGAGLSQSHVCALQDGRFLVVWNDEDPAPAGFASANSVYGRLFNAEGTPNSDAFVIDQTLGDGLLATGAPRAAQLADGRVVVTYSEGLASDPDIKARILDPRTAPATIAGTSYDDDHIGTAFGDIFIEGAGSDKVLAGGGNDEVFGGAGNDMLFGEAGDDALRGEIGDDMLDGGLNADAMRGGAGNDRYFVDNGGDVVIENAGEGFDFITAFLDHTIEDNVENMNLQAGIFGTGNALANVIDGNSAGNVLSGRDGSDRLLGYAGADTLEGGDGADDLNGGVDADTMRGGAGNDRYFLDHSGDVAVENAGEGLDTIETLVDHTIEANVENMVMQGGTTGVGNAESNRIDGNGANNSLNGLNGSDFLLGYDGEDRLDGGNGADTMLGGRGNDRYVVDHVSDVVTEHGGEGLDIVEAYLNYTIALNVENAVLQGGNTVTGNAENNRIDGHGGNNTLRGQGGMDLLLGYGGNDTLEGGADDDIFVFTNGTGSDTILDMQGGISAGDKIDIRNFGFASFDAVMAVTTDVSGGARIQLDGDDSVFVQNMAKAQFDSNDFVLA